MMSVAPETMVYTLRIHDNCEAGTSGKDLRRSAKATLMMDWFSEVMNEHIDPRPSTNQPGCTRGGRARSFISGAVVLIGELLPSQNAAAHACRSVKESRTTTAS